MLSKPSTPGIAESMHQSSRRQTFLRLIAKASSPERSAGGSHELKTIVDVDDLKLLEPPATQEYEGTDEIWSWMRNHRIEGNGPKFLFPSTMAGPDLVFFLKRQALSSAVPGIDATAPDKILVAAQVRRLQYWSLLPQGFLTDRSHRSKRDALSNLTRP
jgi:hypothetical protein